VSSIEQATNHEYFLVVTGNGSAVEWDLSLYLEGDVFGVLNIVELDFFGIVFKVVKEVIIDINLFH